MSKSAIYTASTAPLAVVDGGNLPLGTTIRRFGQDITQDGDTIQLCGCGYFDVVVTATLASTAAGPLTVTLLKDGVPVPGALSTMTVAGTSDQTVLPLAAIVRNKCTCGSTLTVRVDGTGVTADNTAVTVVKL